MTSNGKRKKAKYFVGKNTKQDGFDGLWMFFSLKCIFSKIDLFHVFYFFYLSCTLFKTAFQ